MAVPAVQRTSSLPASATCLPAARTFAFAGLGPLKGSRLQLWKYTSAGHVSVLWRWYGRGWWWQKGKAKRESSSGWNSKAGWQTESRKEGRGGPRQMNSPEQRPKGRTGSSLLGGREGTCLINPWSSGGVWVGQLGHITGSNLDPPRSQACRQPEAKNLITSPRVLCFRMTSMGRKRVHTKLFSAQVRTKPKGNSLNQQLGS